MNRIGNSNQTTFNLERAMEHYKKEIKEVRKAKNHYSNLLKLSDYNRGGLTRKEKAMYVKELEDLNKEIIAKDLVGHCTIHNDIGTLRSIDWDAAAEAGLFCDTCVMEYEKKRERIEECNRYFNDKRDAQPLKLIYSRVTLQNFKNNKDK